MRISDFPLIFNDEEFPIHWKKEYIRLLTTFDVAVELGNGELLIPSALNPDKPNLSHTMFPQNLVSDQGVFCSMHVYMSNFTFLVTWLVINPCKIECNKSKYKHAWHCNL